MDKSEVNTIFEVLLEKIELVANQLKESGAEAFRSGDYDKAYKAIEKATRLANFREKVKALQREWAGLTAGDPRIRQPKQQQIAKNRLEPGLCTPKKAFRRPILETLVELGGSTPANEVFKRVGAKMKEVLNEYDYQPLPHDPRSVRWKNTAQWSRNTLVREGLMKRDSPHGVWEISDTGRRWLLHEKHIKRLDWRSMPMVDLAGGTRLDASPGRDTGYSCTISKPMREANSWLQRLALRTAHHIDSCDIWVK